MKEVIQMRDSIRPKEGIALKETSIYRLEFDIRPDTCNFSAEIAPDFFENRLQYDSPRGEAMLEQIFLDEFKASKLSYKLDRDGRLKKMKIRIGPSPLQGSNTPLNTCQIIWKKNRCFTKGVKTFHQLAALLTVFFKDFFYETYQLSQEGLIPAPLHVEDMTAGASGCGLELYAAPSFMEDFRKMAKSNPDYYYDMISEDGFAAMVIKKYKDMTGDHNSSFGYNRLFYFGNDGYLRAINMSGAPFSVSVGINGSVDQKKIQQGGCFFEGGDLSGLNNLVLVSFLIIFWLVAEEVRKFHENI
ncbi:hypothetical protein ACFLZS_01185 [Patescibacteria group bacterium]